MLARRHRPPQPASRATAHKLSCLPATFWPCLWYCHPVGPRVSAPYVLRTPYEYYEYTLSLAGKVLPVPTGRRWP